jgi:hypothetical protein
MNKTDTAAHELARALFVVSLPVHMIYAETARDSDNSSNSDSHSDSHSDNNDSHSDNSDSDYDNNSDAWSEPPHETVVRILADAFSYLVKRHGASQMQQATELLQHAFDVICSEIYVPADIGQDHPRAPGP